MLRYCPKFRPHRNKRGCTLVLLWVLAGFSNLLTAGVPISVSVEQSPSQADPARLVPIVFSVTFSESVSGFDSSDVTLGGSAGPTQASVTGNGSEYRVAVSGMTQAGSVTVSIVAGVAQNAGGQLNEPSTSVDNIVTFDGTAPILMAFERHLPLEEVTDADALTFRATFDEAVTTPIPADFDVDGPTTALVTSVLPVTAEIFDLTVSGGSLADLNGSVGVNLRQSQSIEDLAGNRLATTEPLVDESYLVENRGPQADLFITNTNGRNTAALNGMLDYVITVGNTGPDAVIGAVVEDVVEQPLEGGSWICEASSGASCSASGSGNILDQVNLPVDGEVVYTLTVTVMGTMEGPLENTASVEPPEGVEDPALGNNAATDLTQLIERIFSDSFETLPLAKMGEEKMVRPLPDADSDDQFRMHERYSNGWEYRGSFLNADGYWVPGPWVPDDSRR